MKISKYVWSSDDQMDNLVIMPPDSDSKIIGRANYSADIASVNLNEWDWYGLELLLYSMGVLLLKRKSLLSETSSGRLRPYLSIWI